MSIYTIVTELKESKIIASGTMGKITINKPKRAIGIDAHAKAALKLLAKHGMGSFRLFVKEDGNNESGHVWLAMEFENE